MPTRWYVQNRGENAGPVEFRELVELVRAGKLAEEERVRADYLKVWQRADSVVGLFYMARRAAAATADDTTRAQAEEVCADHDFSTPPTAHSLEHEQRPGWLERLLAFRSNRTFTDRATTRTGRTPVSLDRDAERAGPDPAEGAAEAAPEAAQTNRPAAGRRGAGARRQAGSGCAAKRPDESADVRRKVWSTAIDAALESVDSGGALARRRRAGWLGRMAARVAAAFPAARARQWFRTAFPFGTALVAANVAGYWVLNWTQRAAQRFPSKNSQTASDLFPFLGECGPVEYSFLLGATMALSGAAAYLAAWWLEQGAE